MPLETNDNTGHIPVLAPQVLELLTPRPGQICVDCTIGRGGHSTQIAQRLSPGGHLVGIDRDSQNVEHSRELLKQSAPKNVTWNLVHANFSELTDVLAHLNIDKPDLLLADLGFSSNQMNDPNRGFSFGATGPLDMRYDLGQELTAAQLVNTLDERSLADLIYQNGQERLSRKIAAKIIDRRRQAPIKDTMALAQIVRSAYSSVASRSRGRRVPRRIDPATRTFMALRIAVNRELDCLQHLLHQLPNVLQPGGVAVIISFHSLEDRLVKTAFRDLDRSGQAKLLTRRPLTATDDERKTNRRSRSAKLRAICFESRTSEPVMA